MMASVGLDNSVHIWDGQNFGKPSRRANLGRKLMADRIMKLNTHNEFVKGVCWDPVGNYLATQVSYLQHIVLL